VIYMPASPLEIPTYGGLRTVGGLVAGLGVINGLGGIIGAYALRDSAFTAAGVALVGCLAAVICFAFSNLLSVAADVGIATTRTANAVEVMVRQRL
jgi:hypothetical protein